MRGAEKVPAISGHDDIRARLDHRCQDTPVAAPAPVSMRGKPVSAASRAAVSSRSRRRRAARRLRSKVMCSPWSGLGGSHQLDAGNALSISYFEVVAKSADAVAPRKRIGCV